MTCGKRYTYRIMNGRHASALLRLQHVHVPLPLQAAPMEEALQTLLGKHDFAAFQASGGTAKTTVRTIHSAHITQEGDTFTMIVEGDAFLYNMVRIIAGTLIEIGHGKLGTDAFAQAIATVNRLCLGPTAPAHVLELTKETYPETAFMAPEAIRWHKE